MIAERDKRTAVVLINPNARRLSASLSTNVLSALKARYTLDVYSTTGRNAAIGLASQAAGAGVELVIAWGGDGHVNEVANGLAGTPSCLGIIAGGTMDVFARTLGVPRDPFDAVAHLTDERRTERMVTLGRMDDRYFTFSAGCGFDAEAAERVESRITTKHRFGEPYFYWSAWRLLASTYRHRNPSMELKGEWGAVGVAMVIASNSGPYAYFLGRPVQLTPAPVLKGGVDVFALRRMRLEALPAYAWKSVISGSLSDHADAFYSTDQEAFEVNAREPFSRHVDGEPLGTASHVRFSVARDVLKVRV
ncbi:MAG: hypothetical protein M3333_01190 [Actinomycetota bacterium]|nr:hypothetical protein [Actinomycetota bacterium]